MYKKLKALLITLIIVVATSITVSAVETSVQSKFVDSNEWTLITTANKSNQGALVEVKITEMYKADGSSSNYTRLYVRLGSSGQQAGQKLLTKGNWTSFTVDKSYAYLGTAIHFYGMGNDPSLDCRISGFFNAH